MNDKLQCPVDLVVMNENKARITALFVLVLAIAFLLTQIWQIFAFLAIDFGLRAANAGKFSPLAFFSDVVIRQFKIGNKPTDRGPKRFAASVGLVFSVSILALVGLQYNLAAGVLSSIIVIFAFLEAFAGFCAGCYVYTFALLLTKKYR